MDKCIITIGRQCGSGGHTIGKMAAERLGISFYDKKILEIVAQRSGLSKDFIKQQGEYKNTSLLFNIATNLPGAINTMGDNNLLPDQVNAIQTDLIKELADKESCIIIGRGADYTLRDRSDCFHVFICGGLEDRKRRVMSEYGIAPDEAELHVLGRDKKRAKHYQYYTERKWGMVENYNLCLDSSWFGVEGCVDIIVNCVKGKF